MKDDYEGGAAMMKFFSGLMMVPAVLLFASAGYADTVHLGIGGNLLGETPLSVGGNASINFSLANATEVTSMSFGIGPGIDASGATYSITLSGPTGILYSQNIMGYPYGLALPLLMPAGNYSIAYAGVACGPCAGNHAAEMDFYSPATFYDVGGTVLSSSVLNPGTTGLGSNLVGQTVNSPVPEPGTAALLGIGLVGLVAAVRRRAHAAG